MPALDKRSGAAASAVQGARETDSTWPRVTVTIKPAAFRGHTNPQPTSDRSVVVPGEVACSTPVLAPPAQGGW